MTKILMKGNEVVGEAAIKGGCRYFFGYPITPQNEIPEYMSKRLPEVGGVFLQAESEIAAINMVYGAAGAGARVMTSSSSPGISLKQEGITYIAGAMLPCVIVNMMRSGPGLGGIQPAQSDYFQATRGGGNGDYRCIVYAPNNLQETADLVMTAFEVTDYYRVPVIILGDGMIGQMMEPVEFKENLQKRDLKEKTWATTGTKNAREHNIINSLFLDSAELEEHNLNLRKIYQRISEDEVLYESFDVEDADVVVVAYGTTSRIVKAPIEECRKEGYKVGMIRPVTLWPFPAEAFDKINPDCKGLLTVEMSLGQMVEDVRLTSDGRWTSYFYGRTGGMVPEPAAVKKEIMKILRGEK